MSVEALAIVLNHSKATGAVKLVLIGIANHINPDNDGAWPSQEKLAHYANCSDRYVRDAINELVKLGELRYESHAGNSRGGNRPNRYWLLLSCPDNCDGTTNHRIISNPELCRTIPGTLSHNTRNPTSGEPLREPLVKPTTRATRLSDDFTITDEMRNWAKTNHPEVDIDKATANFFDYWQTKPSNATKLDWGRTWKTWIRNTKPEKTTAVSRARSKEDRASKARENVIAMHQQLQAKEIESGISWGEIV